MLISLYFNSILLTIYYQFGCSNVGEPPTSNIHEQLCTSIRKQYCSVSLETECQRGTIIKFEKGSSLTRYQFSHRADFNIISTKAIGQSTKIQLSRVGGLNELTNIQSFIQDITLFAI